MNPRTDEVEDVDLFASTIERALGSYPIERLFLNPDCGFGTFANRPMNSGEIAMAKIANMAEAARCVRERQAPAISRP